MNLYFILIELFILGLTLYLFAYKQELAVLYIPVILFARITIEPLTPAFLYYTIVSLLILYLAYKNAGFLRENIFALLLIILYAVLVTQTEEFETIRSSFFALIWLFLSIPLVSAIYKKHDKDTVKEELASAAFLILAVFIVNVAFSTVFNYSPKFMYGITSGILYGNLYATDFNILGIAVFIVLWNAVSKRNLLFLAISIVAIAFIMLSFRRSVMGTTMLGVAAVLLILFSQHSFRKTALFIVLALFAGFVIVMNTSFMDVFIVRYEQRKLDERELGEETRFLEYDILYQDMFVYKDYSPWFGYELLNSSGNYGKGVLEDRTLHSDITNIVHSTGVVGLLLYLLMIASIFVQSCRHAVKRLDFVIILFCGSAFLVYTVTGRYTSTESMMLLILLLMLPLARQENSTPLASGAQGSLAATGFSPQAKARAGVPQHAL